MNPSMLWEQEVRREFSASKYNIEPKGYVQAFTRAAGESTAGNLNVNRLIFIFEITVDVYKTTGGADPTYPVGVKIGEAARNEAWLGDLRPLKTAATNRNATGALRKTFAWPWRVGSVGASQSQQLLFTIDNSGNGSDAITGWIAVDGYQISPRD